MMINYAINTPCKVNFICKWMFHETKMITFWLYSRNVNSRIQLDLMNNSLIFSVRERYRHFGCRRENQIFVSSMRCQVPIDQSSNRSIDLLSLSRCDSLLKLRERVIFSPLPTPHYRFALHKSYVSRQQLIETMEKKIRSSWVALFFILRRLLCFFFHYSFPIFLHIESKTRRRDRGKWNEIKMRKASEHVEWRWLRRLHTYEWISILKCLYKRAGTTMTMEKWIHLIKVALKANRTQNIVLKKLCIMTDELLL